MTRRSRTRWSWSALHSWVLADALSIPEAGETGETVQGRQTEEHTTTSCNIFPNTLPENSLPPPHPATPHPLTPFHLPRGQALPPPRLHLLSADFPAHCPLTFNLNNIPPPSAQTGIRIQPRNLKMYSGGDTRWLRCSFECFIYFFFDSFLFCFTPHYLCVQESSHYLLEWEGVFILFLTLFCCHSENTFCFHSHLTNPLICDVSLGSLSECKI